MRARSWLVNAFPLTVKSRYPSAFNWRRRASIVATLPDLASWKARSRAVVLGSTALTRTTGKARKPKWRSTVYGCGRRDHYAWELPFPCSRSDHVTPRCWRNGGRALLSGFPGLAKRATISRMSWRHTSRKETLGSRPASPFACRRHRLHLDPIARWPRAVADPGASKRYPPAHGARPLAAKSYQPSRLSRCGEALHDSQHDLASHPKDDARKRAYTL